MKTLILRLIVVCNDLGLDWAVDKLLRYLYPDAASETAEWVVICRCGENQ